MGHGFSEFAYQWIYLKIGYPKFDGLELICPINMWFLI